MGSYSLTFRLTAGNARQLRLHAQHLAPDAARATDVAALLRAICGVQAQEQPAAALAVRARSLGLFARDVDRARVEARTIARTWTMRGTLHLHAAEDLGWLLGLLGPIFMSASRGRRAELGLDDDTTARGVHVLCDLLAGRGPQTRAELAEPLAARGIPVAGQALIHLIAYASQAGLVCHGPNRGSKPSYVLLADWADIGPPLEPHAATVELARRYLAAYGPATPEDFASWSGLRLGAVRAAWQRISAELTEMTIDGQLAWLLKADIARLSQLPAAATSARLLPGYDTYLLGYQTRELAVAQAHARRVYPGGGLLRPVLIVDGQAAATWRSIPRSRQIVIVVAPFANLTIDSRTALDAEVQDVGRFLDQAATLQIEGSEPAA